MANATADVYIDNITLGYDRVETSIQGVTALALQTSIQGVTGSSVSTQIRGITAINYVYTPAGRVISADIVDRTNDRMASGTFQYSRTGEGGYYSGNYWKHYEYRLLDYAGNAQPVFVGIFPSSNQKYAAASEDETMMAFTYGWYLSHRYMGSRPELQTLLTPEHQAELTEWQLEFDFQEHYFQPGQTVVGGTSGATGIILRVEYGVWDAIVLRNPVGTFQDDEELLVGGVRYAYADGTAVDITGVATVMTPEAWVTALLGGLDGYSYTTGLRPFKIASTSGIWGGTKPTRDFPFEETTTYREAIEEVSAYLGFIFYERWGGDTLASNQEPRAYWIPQTAIDDPSDGLDLPAAVTVTPTSNSPVDIALDQDGSDFANLVKVRCRGVGGTWYHKTVESSGVTDHTEIPIETPPETNKMLVTQAEVDTRAADVYAYRYTQACTWRITFLRRSDMRRLQLLTFSGFTTKIPDGSYRIIDIEYHESNRGTENTTVCTVILSSAFQTYLNYTRSFTDGIRMIKDAIKQELEKQPISEIGTVSTVDGLGGATFTTEKDGQLKPGIDANP